MSADNYYIVRRHPMGGFVPYMGSASDSRTPGPETDHQTRRVFDTPEEALMSVVDEFAEYGASIHPECYESTATVQCACGGRFIKAAYGGRCEKCGVTA